MSYTVLILYKPYFFSTSFWGSLICSFVCESQAGGPFYPLFTGRRDSIRSYHDEALAEIPKPDDDLTQILHLFALKGFNERETVSLLGTFIQALCF